jgi:uncharacterized MAPEG superfamily protein
VDTGSREENAKKQKLRVISRFNQNRNCSKRSAPMTLAFNWAFYCVLLAGIMPVLIVGIAKWYAPHFDNHHPRDWASTDLTGYRKRAYAAHLNAYEAFPFFAAAVLTAFVLKADPFTTNALALTFIIARIAYAVFYISNQATLRSVAWLVGWAACIALFIKAI